MNDDGLLDSDGMDILECSHVSLSGNSDLFVEVCSGESHLSNMLESSEVNLESSLATLALCILEASLNAAVRLLEHLFTSSDFSGESAGSSDSVSFLIFSVSSESVNASSDSLGILFWVSLKSGNSLSEGNFLGLEGTSFVGSLDRLLATTDNSLLFSETPVELDADGALGLVLLALEEGGFDLI